MALEFHNIFAGRACRCIEPQNDPLVDQFASFSVAQFAESGHSSAWKVARDAAARLMGLRSTHADHGNGRRRAAARQREDRIAQGAQPKIGLITGATWCAPSQIILRATQTMTRRPAQAIQRKRSM